MKYIIRLTLVEIKMALRHPSFWMAVVVLNIFDVYTMYNRFFMHLMPHSSWDMARYLHARIPHVSLAVGLIVIVTMRREYAERYDEILHSTSYLGWTLVLSRYMALVFIGCLLTWQQHLVHILIQVFYAKTPVQIGDYLSFFLIHHLPALAFFAAASVLVLSFTYRYPSTALLLIMILWRILIGAREYIINSEKLYGNLVDFAGRAMFASMDPIFRWFPELKLIILNRLFYFCLAVMAVAISVLLQHRRNEAKLSISRYISLVPVGLAACLTVLAYLADWQVYLNSVQAIDTVIMPRNVFQDVVISEPLVGAERVFDRVDCTLIVQLDEDNRHMHVTSHITGTAVTGSPISDLVFALDSGLEIVALADEKGETLQFSRNRDLLIVQNNTDQNRQSFSVTIEYQGEVWEWEKIDAPTMRPLMMYVNTGWLSQYVTNRAIWLGSTYAWYPKLMTNGREHPAYYRLTVFSKNDQLFVSNEGHLTKTKTASGLYRYEAAVTDAVGLVLVSGPYICFAQDRVKIYCLEEYSRYAQNLINHLNDKIKFYETATKQHRAEQFIIIQSENRIGLVPGGPLAVSCQNFGLYTGEHYPYKSLAVESIDLKLALDYLGHPLEGSMGLGSTALGIGSYIDSLYIKQQGFHEAYEREREYRLAIAELAANNQDAELEALEYQMTKDFDPIKISRLPYSRSSNEVWLALDRLYRESGSEGVFEAVSRALSALRQDDNLSTEIF